MKIDISPTSNSFSDEGTGLISIQPGRMMTNATLGSSDKPSLDGLGSSKKRKPRTKKIGGEEVVTAEEDLPMVQSNVPYHDTYAETDAILRNSIAQLDVVTASLNEDIQAIRDSKTIRKKYDYLAEMNGTMVSSISAKITAARELNNSIKNAHELDLKRMKELKLNEKEADDSKSIMDIYQAFVTTPVSTNMAGGQQAPFSSPLGANTIDLTIGGPNMGVNLLGQDPNSSYNHYVNNMTPEQMTMMIEENPDIKHVIAYDPSSGMSEFAIYNSQNGQFLEGIPTRNKDMYMDGMNFNFETMQAHSNDLNETFDIIYVNTPYSPNGQEQVKASPDTTSATGKDMSNY